ncbi:phosphotransferase [Nonomuraea sp. NPDC047897]|uniref:phosphotransferase n=1 Tax=Nonomuraea sp. NPDC047897 TaxID=3364346 RepID=UPI00371D3290
MSPLDSYARLMARPAAALRLVSGESADVVLDAAAGLAWRFPHRPADQAALARRITLVRAHGLPAPEVVRVRDDCLVTRLVTGRPLSPEVEADPAALAGLLARAATVPVEPEAGDWRAEWRELLDDVRRRVAPLLAPEQARRAVADAQRALAAAESAPTGFVHGDLGGANVLMAGGAVAAVLDWEASGPGDPAVDLAALSVSVAPPVRDRLAAGFPALTARAAAYAATFALQEAVHGLRHDDPDAVAAGLAPYRLSGPR